LSQVVFLLGPTATGKSDIAIEVLRRWPEQYEIISVDSALVYRHMNIGTAKPDSALRHEIVHHLIDIREPEATYSAADFCDDANRLVADIISRGKKPLLVGGTMLYFKALKDGLANMPAADQAVRQRLVEEAKNLGWEALHQRLSQVDPLAAARIKATDTQRLQRALEVYEVSGKPISEIQAEPTQQFSYQTLQIGLMPADRSLLHSRIEQRFRQMLSQGFIEEVENLRHRGDLDADSPAMRSVGYRQIWSYLEGEFALEEMTFRGIAATRQLAKRQMTWMRSWSDLEIIPSDDTEAALQQALKMLE